MKKTVLLALFAFFLVGCDRNERVIVVETPAKSSPQILVTPPQEPAVPYTPSYIRGYNDGYSGVWLAPGRWLVANEYRAGWDAGRIDRASNKANRFR